MLSLHRQPPSLWPGQARPAKRRTNAQNSARERCSASWSMRSSVCSAISAKKFAPPGAPANSPARRFCRSGRLEGARARRSASDALAARCSRKRPRRSSTSSLRSRTPTYATPSSSRRRLSSRTGSAAKSSTGSATTAGLAARLLGSEASSYRQVGHVWWRSSHGRRHEAWKTCAHGIRRAAWFGWKSSRQIAHCVSGSPAQCVSASIAAALAGAGAAVPSWCGLAPPPSPCWSPPHAIPRPSCRASCASRSLSSISFIPEPNGRPSIVTSVGRRREAGERSSSLQAEAST
mmetsp:Transcript_31847/g.74308  ORF Transcript_31847/g.74308 Transcript_31847/m.74308 type:complete len:291 (+) Transcript_31847:363-1235(+)